MTNSAATVTNNSHRIWWQLFALLAVSAAAVSTGIAFDEQKDKFWPETEILISVFNKKPSGLSALRELTDKVGIKSAAWQLPYRTLDSKGGMLVICQPTESLSDLDTSQILDWVKKGNDLIYLDHFSYKMTRRLPSKIDVQIKDGEEFTDKTILVDRQKKIPEFQNVPALTISAERRIVGGTPLLADKSGTLLSEIKHGQGRILLGTVPNLCSNRRLDTQADWANFQFLINWLSTAHGEVLFDEKCHGFSSATNVFHFLLRGPAGLIFWQLILILAVAVLSTTQRFGAMRHLAISRKISSLEYIFGLSNAFRRAKANTAVLEILGQSFRNRLCKVLGISPHESSDILISSWRNSKHADFADMATLIEQYESALSRKNLSDMELRSLVGSCDKITSAIADTATANADKAETQK